MQSALSCLSIPTLSCQSQLSRLVLVACATRCKPCPHGASLHAHAMGKPRGSAFPSCCRLYTTLRCCCRLPSWVRTLRCWCKTVAPWQTLKKSSASGSCRFDPCAPKAPLTRYGFAGKQMPCMYWHTPYMPEAVPTTECVDSSRD